MRIGRNAVGEFNGRLIRILRAVENPSYGVVRTEGTTNASYWCIDIEDSLAWPFALSMAHLSLLPDVDVPLAARTNLTDVEIDARDRAWALLDRLVQGNCFDDLCDPKKRKAAISAHVEKLRAERDAAARINKKVKLDTCSEPTLYSWLRRFFQRGQSPAALVPDYLKCGRAQRDASEMDKVLGFMAPEAELKQNDDITAGRGGVSKRGVPTFQITTVDQDNMRAILREHLASDIRFTVPGAHDELKTKFYSRPDGNGKSHHLPEGEYPSLRQFRYFYEQIYSPKQRKLHRMTQKDFDLTERTQLEAAIQRARGPGYVYEVDATVLECYVVEDEAPYDIIGKPTLYLIVDRWSRLIVGYTLTLENPSWSAALMALLSIFEDKAALCAQYGVEYKEREWPAHEALCQEFLADRGSDWTCDASMAIPAGLGASIANLPAGRADMKPYVENCHRLLNKMLRKFEPSSDPDANTDARQKIDYKGKACARMRDMNRYTLEAIIALNKKQYDDFPRTPEMLSMRVKPNPIELWNYGVEYLTGAPQRVTEDQARLLLLPRGKAGVNEHGIKFKDVYFKSKELAKQGVFDAAVRDTDYVEVSYDPRSVEAIYVHPPKPSGQVHVATRSSRSAQYANLSFAQVARCEKERKAGKAGASDANGRIHQEFLDKVRPGAEARAELVRVATEGRSRAARTKHSKVKREAGLAKERSSQPTVRPLGGSSSTAPLAPHPTSHLRVVPAATAPATPTSVPASSPVMSQRDRAAALRAMHSKNLQSDPL